MDLVRLLCSACTPSRALLRAMTSRMVGTILKLLGYIYTMKRSGKLLLIIGVSVGIAFIFCSCNFSKKSDAERVYADSVEISGLLQKVYQWHDKNKDRITDYDVIVKDSFQVGIDTAKLMFAVNELKKTTFFTDGFIKNYERIGRETDYKLKHDTVKYYNEINFSFQDADPWTYFQDDAGNYWDSLKIHNLAINGDTASLGWTIQDIPINESYIVKFKREQNGWKIAYLKGFDL